MKKILHSIETSRYQNMDKKSPMNNITTPRFSLNPLNHPRSRFLSYSVMPILFSLLAGLFILTACEENKSTDPDPKTPPPDPTLSFDVSGVVAEGAFIKGASISLYLSGADSSLDSTTSDSQGRYSFTLEGIRANTLSLRLVATYLNAGEAITLRSYVDLTGISPSQSQELIVNINEITEFAFTLASVQTEIDEEALNTLNRIIDRISDLLGVEGNLDFRTSPYDRTLDSYQELIQFQEQTDDPSMIDILRKDDDTVVTNFGKILLTDVDRPQSIQETIDAFQNHTIRDEIISVRDLPIPTLASGAPGEVTRLSATPGKEQIILGWSDPEDANFDHVEISWMVDGGTSSEPVSVLAGEETFTVTNLEGDVLYIFTIVTSDSEGNTSAGVRISETPSPDMPPTINPITDKEVQAGGSSITVNITASDPDGDIPSLDYFPALDYAIFTDRGDGTATLVFDPDLNVPLGPTNITITATSGELTDIEQFTLTITASAVDNPPVITTIANQMVQAGGSSITVNIIATDPDDGQTPTLSYSPELLYATFTDNLNGTATLVFNPGPDVDPVATNITITASSGELTDTEQFTLTITAPAVDKPPTIDTITNISVQAGGSSITVNITASDPDGQTPSLDYSPELFYATFTDNDNGTATLVIAPGREIPLGPTNITITAFSGELTNIEQFTLTITAPTDRGPGIDSIIPNPVTVRVGETNRVTVTASDPDAGETPTLDLDGTEPTFVTIVDNLNGSATITIRPEAGEPPDTNTINVVATSGDKATTNDFILIIGSAVDGDGDGVLDIDDVDDDNDGLIEINTLDDLHNIRYNLAGTSYKTSAIDAGNMNGAPGSGLNGYELTRDLDFNDPTSYSSGMVNTAWTMRSGWLPIGDNSRNDDSTRSRFTGILEGNGHKITNLMIRQDMSFVGFFGYIGRSGQVRNLGIENGVADYTGNDTLLNFIGLLAGLSDGTIIAVHTSGIADGGNGTLDFVGGLVGDNNGTITACYATGMADGGNGQNDSVGGLVGDNSGTITACYATGMADGGEGDLDRVGGLVGDNSGTITACYATGNANGGEGDLDHVGGLVGDNNGTITACYGFGMVTGEERAGVDRSGDASATVTNASALTMTNSSTREENRWSARVWDFGTDSQVPVLKWITGYDSSRTTEAERYPCDVALLPAGRECGDIIPGQER